jgi:hypothetical protein
VPNGLDTLYQAHWAIPVEAAEFSNVKVAADLAKLFPLTVIVVNPLLATTDKPQSIVQDKVPTLPVTGSHLSAVIRKPFFTLVVPSEIEPAIFGGVLVNNPPSNTP